MLPEAGSYWLVRFLFQRGLVLIYLIAFLVAATQFRPLADLLAAEHAWDRI